MDKNMTSTTTTVCGVCGGSGMVCRSRTGCLPWNTNGSRLRVQVARSSLTLRHWDMIARPEEKWQEGPGVVKRLFTPEYCSYCILYLTYGLFH